MLSAPVKRHSVGAKFFDAVVRLPFGFVGVRTLDAALQEICFLDGEPQALPPATALARRVVEQLRLYCVNASTEIDVPLIIEGTDFQRRVWNEIRGIPAGSTATYGELARRLNSAARAVGQACGDNRLPLAIPCHRVISAAGLGGFAHHRGGVYGGIKRWLLMHELGGELRLA